MEWYMFDLNRFFIFLFAVSSGLAIVLTIVFGKSVIERGPDKHIEMN